MSIDDLKEHIEVIRHLDPKPGSRYNPTQSQYVIPDVYVMKVEEECVAVLNEDGLPQMRISPVYRRLLDKSASDNTDETRAYVKDKFRSALWLIKSVEQRQKTIFKVAKSIINFQKDFLDHGIEHCGRWCCATSPTTSACTNRRSAASSPTAMHTPRACSRSKASSTAASAARAAERLVGDDQAAHRKIIENEDPRKPLSDSKIVSILQREGLVLARRTIANAREELKIPTSNQPGLVLGGLQGPPYSRRATSVARRRQPSEPLCDSNSEAITSTSRPSSSASSARSSPRSKPLERPRRLGEGDPHHREAPPSRQHHAARARRNSAQRGRNRQMRRRSAAPSADLAAGAEIKGKRHDLTRHSVKTGVAAAANSGSAAAAAAAAEPARRGARPASASDARILRAAARRSGGCPRRRRPAVDADGGVVVFATPRRRRSACSTGSRTASSRWWKPKRERAKRSMN